MFRAATLAFLLTWLSTATAQNGGQSETFPRLQERVNNAMGWSKLKDSIGKETTVEISEKDDDPILISMTRETKTNGRGLLRLEWDQREVASLKVLEVRENLYLVLSVDGSTSLKAPAGAWHIENEDVPDFYKGPDVGGMIRGELKPMIRDDLKP